MGLSVAERAYIRSIERAGIRGSDDSKGEDSLEDSEEEVGSDDDDGGRPAMARMVETLAAAIGAAVTMVAATVMLVAMCHWHK
jgi:hypothetical protein